MNHLKHMVLTVTGVGLILANSNASAIGSEKVYTFNTPGNYIESNQSLTNIEQSLGRLQLMFVANDIPGDTYPSKYVISGDYNNDGNFDIFSALWSPKLFSGDGNGVFNESSLSERAYNAVSADFNNDGNLDVYTVAMGGMQQNYLHLGDGNGSFVTSIIPGDIGGASTSATAADFNEDGNVDLYVTNLSMYGASGTVIGENKMYLGDGSGSFTDGNFFGNTENSSDSVAADFNNDGHMDLYVANFDWLGNKVFLGDGTGAFPVMYDHGGGIQSVAVTAADFNNDGNMDVYIANPYFNQFYLGDGAGGFISAHMQLYNSGIYVDDQSKDVISRDFDNDGNMDLYVANIGQNKLYMGNGLGGFTSEEITGDLGRSHGVTSDDFNNDGLLDIYVSNEAMVSYNPPAPAVYEQNKLYLSSYSNSAPYIQAMDPHDFTSPLTSFNEVLGVNNEGEVVYQFSLDGGATWKYYNGSSWINTTQVNGTEANTASQFNVVSLGALAASGSLIWRAYLISDGTQRVEIDKIVVSYKRKHKVPPKLPAEIDASM